LGKNSVVSEKHNEKYYMIKFNLQLNYFSEFLRLIVPKSSPPSASKVTEYIKNVEKLEKDWRDIKNKFKDLSSNLVSDVTNIDKLSLLGSIEASLTYTFDYEFDDKNDSEKN
jgi:hypothetical protein